MLKCILYVQYKCTELNMLSNGLARTPNEDKQSRYPSYKKYVREKVKKVSILMVLFSKKSMFYKLIHIHDFMN